MESVNIGNFKTVPFDVTLTLDTAIYASGDVLTDTAPVALPRMPPDNPAALYAEITSVQVLDEDNQGIALDLVFLKTNVSLGTKNAAVSISDANAREIVGIVPVAAADYKALANSQQAFPQFNPIPMALPAAAFYVAAISRGAGTYSAAGVRLRIGVRLLNLETW